MKPQIKFPLEASTTRRMPSREVMARREPSGEGLTAVTALLLMGRAMLGVRGTSPTALRLNLLLMLVVPFGDACARSE